ncbi:hypothetical protein BAU07_19030 [Bordetella flabilis]|uniref:Uncharacterized protein n=1 Tax=Bordetella flabilis TaxID=463014 RepID=A0A193GGJ0_9BORD|nr:hypothetical protein BAU07_19030 [Bordetella flabilis]
MCRFRARRIDVDQLALFDQQPQQPKSAEQLTYEAWPFPGLSWEQHQEIQAEWKAYAEKRRREQHRRIAA